MSVEAARLPDPVPTRLPVTVEPVVGEAIDSYLERLAAANVMPHPALAARLRAAGACTTFLTIATDPQLIGNLTVLGAVTEGELAYQTLAELPGIDTAGLDPARKATWRTVAARGWPPEPGTALCPRCLVEDGVWRLAWRHPWVSACLRHRAWLLRTCPACGRRFRGYRTPLRPVDAAEGTCGNPAGVRGRNCPQPLNELHAPAAPPAVLETQARIDAAIAGDPVALLGGVTEPDTYLAEIKALTVLLLHLATQPGADTLAAWSAAARSDRDRSTGGRGARWGLAPPADLELRGRAIAAADAILREPDLEAAADALHPWTDLTPASNEGQLGWLADHTTMTPTLTRLVMAATAQRRRLSTLLIDQTAIEARFIPQAMPADLYTRLQGTLGVTHATGRVFASLCLAKRGRPRCTWADAETLLDLTPGTGIDAVRACTGAIICGPPAFVELLNGIATQLAAQAVDYRAREAAVRGLVRKRRWYTTWARIYRPGSLPSSRRYAITFLWTIYAGSTPRSSPAWRQRPTTAEMAYYRRYAMSINAHPEARRALLAQVAEPAPPRALVVAAPPSRSPA